MKILLVAGKLTYSNSARYTLALVKGLQARGHQVHVAALGGPLFPSVANLASEAYQVKFNYFSYRRLVQFLAEFSPAVVHATGGSTALKTATKLARSLDVPLVHSIHSWLAADRTRDAYRYVEGLIAPNEGLREHLVNDQNLPKNRIRVIPYGIETFADPARDGADSTPRDQDGVITARPARESEDSSVAPEDTSATAVLAEAPPATAQRAARELPEVAENPPTARIPVVGTIGRLEKGRRHGEFIEAAARVRELAKEVHFVVAGEGPGENHLRRQVKQLAMEDAITFVQPQNTDVDIYGILDVLVIISDWGGVGFNLLEGLARGRPVIATGGGEVYSVLGEEDVCKIVPAADTEQLATAILELLSNPERRRELGENGRAFVTQHYPLADQIVRVETYYAEVCAQRQS